MSQREILFKAKRIDNGECVEGFAGCKGSETDLEKWYIMQSTFCANPGVGYPFYFTDIEVDPQTLCQYTGLTDKNAVKAFENDKVYDPHENRIFTIKWDRELAAFFLMDDDGWMNKDIARLSYCEIIGNIHDN